MPEQIRNRLSDDDQYKSGILTGQVVYFIVNKELILWDSDPKIKTSDYNIIGFSTEIKEVCYVENYKDKFKPYLCIATKTEIQFRQFEENNRARRHLKRAHETSFLNQASILNSFRYNLIDVKNSDKLVLTLEIDEIACKIL